ncbi:MAG: NAD(P)-dependent oxidoreductase [Gammaproteobacteria bacterium]|nr:NAD(P)-dependent oxidoreductase [Gammaproteobacteria bacterium]
MKRVGVIGLGDMGSGLAKNLIKAGFATSGFDLSAQRMRAFTEMGGKPAENCAQVGENSDVVFLMVMNGAQVIEVIFGEQGLLTSLAPGSVIILTATINPAEAREVAARLENTDIALIDSPVSGGFPGAQSGTLTMMAAGRAEVLDDCRQVMEAVSKTIHRVGDTAGMGQTVKACLQSLIGSIFSATFEASVLAAKAGVEGQVLYDVFSTSGAGCGITNTALENIIDRRFADSGSHIATMYKDLTIALDMARELGVPLFTASTAMQLFQAGKTRHPDGDNWVVTRVIEEIVGSQLKR